MKTVARSVVLGAAALWMIGCASARLEVMTPLRAPEQRVALELEGAPGSGMTEEQRGRYQSILTSRLTEKGIMVVSSDAPVAHGTVAKFDPGSRALRYWIGFGAGRGTLDTRWDVMDQSGAVVGSCRIRGGLAIGIFGGNFDDVLEKSADRLSQFLNGQSTSK